MFHQDLMYVWDILIYLNIIFASVFESICVYINLSTHTYLILLSKQVDLTKSFHYNSMSQLRNGF